MSLSCVSADCFLRLAQGGFMKVLLSLMAVLVVFFVSACTQEDDTPERKPVPTPPPTAVQGFETYSAQSLLAEGLARHEQGKFDEALDFFELAYQRFADSQNTAKMAEVLSAKSLTLRRLDRLEEAQADLETAVELTQGTEGVVLPLYNLAKVQEQIGDSTAVETYQRALAAMRQYQPAPHYRAAVLNDMEVHLGVSQLLFEQDPGDAEERVLLAIEALLEDEELDAFGKMVWASGGYLGLARHYLESDPAQAWEYFDLAEEIIFAYPDQTVLRRQDLEDLRAEMPARP